ncbi:3'-5' exonuclease [Marinimicrobium sp. C2-29]|uniref:3'-5' exonuclease n=1 Tax=Marinimicrobium sp. C2-29 TaxID=3139825 RepID=UPI00313A1DDF
MQAAMKATGIPSTWLKSLSYKKTYDPSADKVTLLTRQSSKGLEFDTVILAGLGGLDDSDEQLPIETRLLYVGMTRAHRQLLVTSSGENTFTEKLQELVGTAA